MKSGSRARNSIIAVSTLLAIPSRFWRQKAPQNNAFPHYAVTDLGTLGAGDNATAFDMNNVGWVAGSSNLTAGGPQHAFVWYGHGPLKDLGTLDGAACPTCNSAADGPNLLGQTAIGSGNLHAGSRRRGFLRLWHTPAMPRSRLPLR